jgi:outer membrane immunogenic protein
MKNLTIAAFALSALASPAMAQSFTGPHVEAQAGWDHADIPDQTGTTGNRVASDDRMIYGVGAGYDVSLGGPVIAGVDGSFDLGNHGGCASDVAATGDRLCSKLVRDFDIGARLGVQAGSTLFYGRVGYANSLVRSTYVPPTGSTVRDSEQDGGLRLGAGVEHQIGGGAYLKAEYRYTTASDLDDHHQLLGGIGIRF